MKELKLKKCPECGGRLEQLYSAWVCLRCYKKLTDAMVADALVSRLAEIKVEIESESASVASIAEIANQPFFWDTEGEPIPEEEEGNEEIKVGQGVAMEEE